MKPGLHHNVSVADYDAIDAIRNSFLNDFLKSPKMAMAREERTSAAMALGSAAHCLVLTPGLFDGAYVIFDGKTRRGKAWEAFKVINEDKTILTAGEWETTQKIASAVAQHPAAAPLLMDGHAEVTAIFELYGVKCKARFDYLRADAGFIIDLKTTRDPSPEAFATSAQRYGYWQQSAFYSDAWEAVRGTGSTVSPEFKIIAVQSSAPFEVVVYDLPLGDIENGREQYQKALRRYSECKEAGHFPGISDDVLTLEYADDR